MTGHRPWSEIKHKKDCRREALDGIMTALDLDPEIVANSPPGINHWSYIMDNCTCPEVHLNNALKPDVVGRNWNPDCWVHGLESDWYNAAEQITKRRADNDRLRDLQLRASEAKARARAMAAHPSTPRSTE